jgi:hypothetical protein
MAAIRSIVRRPAARRLLAVFAVLVVCGAVANAVGVLALINHDGATAAWAYGLAGAVGLVTAALVGYWWAGPVENLVAAACGEAFSLALGSFLAWPSDPGTSTCPGTQPCDTAFGLGAFVLWIALCLPIIAASFGGYALARRSETTT